MSDAEGIPVIKSNQDGTTCDVCGGELPWLYARVTIKWSFAEGFTLFGALLKPGATRRVVCPSCFSRMAESTAMRIGAGDE